MRVRRGTQVRRARESMSATRATSHAAPLPSRLDQNHSQNWQTARRLHCVTIELFLQIRNRPWIEKWKAALSFTFQNFCPRDQVLGLNCQTCQVSSASPQSSGVEISWDIGAARNQGKLLLRMKFFFIRKPVGVRTVPTTTPVLGTCKVFWVHEESQIFKILSTSQNIKESSESARPAIDARVLPAQGPDLSAVERSLV